MLITDIRKLDDKRFVLWLDYEPYCSLYSSDIRRLKLEKDKEIDSSVIDEFRKEYLFKRAMNKAINSIKFSEKCCNDIRIKLSDLYYDNGIIDYVIDKLISYQYLDDKRYASNYIRRNINKKGINNIVYELKNKKVDSDIICSAIEELELPDSKNVILNIMEKRYTLNDIIERRDKVFSYFVRKGYSFNDVNECIRIFMNS